MSKKELRERTIDDLRIAGRLPRFGDLIANEAGELVGFFVRGIRVMAGRPDAGPWFQITDGRGTFWNADPAEHRVAPRQRLSIAQIAILLAAWDRTHAIRPFGLALPILEMDRPDDADPDAWRPAMDHEVEDLATRRPALVLIDDAGVVKLTPAGRAAIELMTEVEQADVALRFVGAVRQAAAQAAKAADRDAD